MNICKYLYLDSLKEWVWVREDFLERREEFSSACRESSCPPRYILTD